jgi:ferrochelatase
MITSKTAILLMNVGSPDKPEVSSVRKYLTQFLNDKRVIDLPWLLRKLLVNAIIIPFRVKKSTSLYKRLWTKNGSPLIFYSQQLKEKLQKHLGKNYGVYVGMRYGHPSIKNALIDIKNKNYNTIVLFPLFPHYAMSTSETALAEAERQIKKLQISADIFPIKQFYNHPKFIAAFAEQAEKYDLKKYDHVVFSYHGLPDRQVEKCHPGIKVGDCQCQHKLPEHGKFCYRATSFATSRKIAEKLGLEKGSFTTGFQSRLSKNWLTPFTDNVLMQRLKEGKKNILVLAPSFVTDCLETILEIGFEYREDFVQNGGQKLQLVESLNTEDSWVETMKDLIYESTKQKV